MERYEQQNAGQDLGAAARSGAEAAKGGMNDLAEKGQEAASKLNNALSTARTKIQESTSAGARATDRVIRDHP